MTTHFGLIIIGDEILSGKRADKHLPKVIELLSARGMSLAYADYVGDDPARITATLARAFAAARDAGDVVFSCGGIGATPDDHTRQCAADALGVKLVLHPEAKLLIESRMRDVAKEQGVPYEPDRHDNIHRLNMGTFPEGAEIIANPYNKIPGFSCFVDSLTQPESQNGLRPAAGAATPLMDSNPLAMGERRDSAFSPAGAAEPALPGRRRSAPSGGSWLLGSDANFASVRSTELAGQAEGLANSGSDPKNQRGGIHFVPGFPVMAWPMIEAVLDSRYAGLHQQSAYREQSVIVMGAMEAALTPLMLHIEAEHAQVKVFSLPSVDHPQYGRHIELGVKGSPEAVKRAFPALLAGLHTFGADLGPELVR